MEEMMKINNKPSLGSIYRLKKDKKIFGIVDYKECGIDELVIKAYDGKFYPIDSKEWKYHILIDDKGDQLTQPNYLISQLVFSIN